MLGFGDTFTASSITSFYDDIPIFYKMQEFKIYTYVPYGLA